MRARKRRQGGPSARSDNSDWRHPATADLDEERHGPHCCSGRARPGILASPSLLQVDHSAFSSANFAVGLRGYRNSFRVRTASPPMDHSWHRGVGQNRPKWRHFSPAPTFEHMSVMHRWTSSEQLPSSTAMWKSSSSFLIPTERCRNSDDQSHVIRSGGNLEVQGHCLDAVQQISARSFEGRLKVVVCETEGRHPKVGK